MQPIHECRHLMQCWRQVVLQSALFRVFTLIAVTAILVPLEVEAAVCEVNDVDVCLNAGPYLGNPGVAINVAVPTSVELPSTDLINSAGTGVDKSGVGSMTFFNYGSIVANNPIKIFSGETTIENFGDISGVFAGIIVDSTDDVTIINNSGATISSTNSLGVALIQTGGKTLFNAGTISGSGNSISSALGSLALTLDTGSILNGAVSALGASDSLTLNGSGSEDDDFTGFQTLTMQGGQWTLSGSVSMGAGSANVNNGTLLIDGTMTGANVSVAAAGALGGMGSITGDVDVSGQIDTTMGDLTIDGGLTFQTGSSLAVSLGGGTSTKVDVTGNTIISGGTDIVLSGDLTQDAAVTILTSGGLVSGSFDKVVDENGKQLFFTAISEPNEVGLMKVATVGVSEVVHQAVTGVTLDAHRGLLNTIHARIDHRYRDSAHKRTKRNTFASGAPSSGSLMTSQLSAGQSALWQNDLSATIQNDKFTPGFIADMIAAEQTGTDQMHRSMSALPRLQVSSNYGGMWLEGFGVKSEQDAGDAVTGYKATSSGASIGLDSKAANNWTFGGMVAYSISDVDLDLNAGGADGETAYVGAYMANISRTHYANLFITAAVAQFDATRAVTDGLVSGVASDEFGSYMWDARLELGRTFGMANDNYFRPNVSVEYISTFQDDYVDDGAGIVPGLTIKEHTTEIFRAEGQFDVLFGSMNIDDEGWSGRFFGGAAHEVFLDDQETNAFVDGFVSPVNLATGGDDHRTLAIYGVSLSWAVSQRMRWQFSYQGESNSDFGRHNVVAGFSVGW